MGIVSKTIVYRNENHRYSREGIFQLWGPKIFGKKVVLRCEEMAFAETRFSKFSRKRKTPGGTSVPPPGPLPDWLFGGEGAPPHSLFFQGALDQSEKYGNSRTSLIGRELQNSHSKIPPPPLYRRVGTHRRGPIFSFFCFLIPNHIISRYNIQINGWSETIRGVISISFHFK